MVKMKGVEIFRGGESEGDSIALLIREPPPPKEIPAPSSHLPPYFS